MGKRVVWLMPVVVMVLCGVLLSTAAVGPASAVVPLPQILLEVHPNERGEGPPTTTLDNGGPFWIWPTPSGSGSYDMEVYQFFGSGSLWIQVCAQAYSASQNLANNGFAKEDIVKMLIDGQTPSDVWGIQSGLVGKAQWRGSVDAGQRLTLEFLVTQLVPGKHTLRFTASMCPVIWWIKVYDLEERMPL